MLFRLPPQYGYGYITIAAYHDYMYRVANRVYQQNDVYWNIACSQYNYHYLSRVSCIS